MTILHLESCGAVTPVGLLATTTYAALRAGISRIEDSIAVPPPGDPLKAARVKAARPLQRSPREWLMNLAARALHECVTSLRPQNRPVGLLVCLPERSRAQPGMLDVPRREVPAVLAARCGLDVLATDSEFEGPASVFEALLLARRLLERQMTDCVLIGGADSLVNHVDLDRLQDAHRLHSPENPQGVIPGEGAAFIAVSLSGRAGRDRPLAALLGMGTAQEPRPASCGQFSTGDGLVAAIHAALADANTPESDIDFIVSNHNGERYVAWESTFMQARVYRTRRAHQPRLIPAASIGDIGAPSSVLSIIVAAHALARGHQRGRVAICEGHASEALRGACLVGPSAPDGQVKAVPS